MDSLALDVTAAPPPPAALAPLAWRARVAWLRRHRLAGSTLTFVPYAPAFAQPLLELRNRPHNQFNLAQDAPLTPEQQRAWSEAYAARDNDLCWIVLTAGGEFAGATRLYDIDGDAGSAEKGGLVLREELARGTPLALESELMLLHLACRWLGLARIVTSVRPENTKMCSINDRLGFRPAGETTLRGRRYLRAELAAAGFDPAPLLPILRHWKTRHAR